VIRALRFSAATATALILEVVGLIAELACSSSIGPYRTEIRRFHPGMSREDIRHALGEPYGYWGHNEFVYYRKGSNTLLAVLMTGSELCPANGDGACGWLLAELPPAGPPPFGTFAYYKVNERGGAAITSPYAVGKEITSPFWDALVFNDRNEIMSLVKANRSLALSKTDDPLSMVVSNNDKDLAEFLLSNGAEVNGATRANGLTPLHQAARNRNKTLAELLLAHGADVNATDNDGETPLHELFCEGGDPKELNNMIDLLLAHGADVRATNKYAETPLGRALACHNDQAAQFLQMRLGLLGNHPVRF
jgi:hypothetical protein